MARAPRSSTRSSSAMPSSTMHGLTIGVAKTRLIGEHREPPDRRGTWAPLRDDGETIGAVLRTRACVKPVYVSIGHRVSLATAIRYVMACCTRYRLPETTRHAHRLASGP